MDQIQAHPKHKTYTKTVEKLRGSRAHLVILFTASQIQDRPRIASDDIKNIPKVIILTPKQINEKAKKVLIKYELKFTPRPRSDHEELKTDIKKFCIKLRLTEYTADTDGNANDISLKKIQALLPLKHTWTLS